MSTHITGKLILAGDYTQEEQIDPAEPLARVVVVMTGDQLRDVATLPMHDEVTVIRSDELAALRAEVERLRAALQRVTDWGAPLLYASSEREQNQFIADMAAARAARAQGGAK